MAIDVTAGKTTHNREKNFILAYRIPESRELEINFLHQFRFHQFCLSRLRTADRTPPPAATALPLPPSTVRLTNAVPSINPRTHMSTKTNCTAIYSCLICYSCELVSTRTTPTAACKSFSHNLLLIVVVFFVFLK